MSARRILRLWVPAALLAAGTIGGGLFGNRLLALSGDYHQYLREYTDILATIGSHYAEDIAADKLVYSSIDGMLRTLDPHSSFLDPSDYTSMQEKQKGSFSGLGIIVSMRNDKVTVISPLQGTPAERLGIRAGDVIGKIDGESTEGKALDEVVKKLKGPKGSEVRISIVRAGLDAPLELTVVREEISTTSIRHAFMLTPGIGYVRINDFTSTTARELEERVRGLRTEGMEKLVLDLRGNPGGLLDQAVAVSDVFLRKGQLVVYTKGRNASSLQEYFAPGEGSLPEVPLVVLINKGSASASEIVAGAIQDHDRGVVVGTTSWGKGLVQTVYTLSYGAGLALTTAKYFTPSGRCIQRDYSSLYDYLSPELEDARPDNSQAPAPGPAPESFKTDTGRRVFGGGGITPDIVVKQPELSKFTQLLEARGAFFTFGVRFANRSQARIDRSFEAGPEVLDEFADFLVKEKILSAAEVAEALRNEADRNYVRQNLREEVLNTLFGLEAGYRVTVESDVQVQTAIKSFPEAERLAQAAAGRVRLSAARRRGERQAVR